MHPQDTTAQIPLRSHTGVIRTYAIIDAADLPLVSAHRWHLDGCGYAATNIRINGKWHTVKLHRFLLGLERGDGMEADHRNRDRLDNRRGNLRVFPRAGRANAQNCTPYRGGRSQFRGVSYDKSQARWKPWVAVVNVNGRPTKIGRFHTEEEAADAARAARARHLPYAVD